MKLSVVAQTKGRKVAREVEFKKPMEFEKRGRRATCRRKWARVNYDDVNVRSLNAKM